MIVNVRPILSVPCHDEVYDNSLIMTSTIDLDGDLRDDSYHEFGDRLVIVDHNLDKFIEVVELLPPNKYVHVFTPVRDGSLFWIMTTSLIKEGDTYRGVVSVPIIDPSYFTPDLWLAYRLTANAYYRLDGDQVQSYIKALYFLLIQHYGCKMQELNRVVIPSNLKYEKLSDLSKIQRVCAEIDIITQYGQPYHAVDILDTFMWRFGHQVNQQDSEVLHLIQDQYIEPTDIAGLSSQHAKQALKKTLSYPDQAYILSDRYMIPSILTARPYVHTANDLFMNILSLGCGGEVNVLMKIEQVVIQACTSKTHLAITQLEYTTTLPIERPDSSLVERVKSDLITYLTLTYPDEINILNLVEIQLEKYGYICFIYFAWMKGDQKQERKVAVNLLQQVPTLPIYDLINVETDPLYEFGGWDYAASIWDHSAPLNL